MAMEMILDAKYPASFLCRRSGALHGDSVTPSRAAVLKPSLRRCLLWTVYSTHVIASRTPVGALRASQRKCVQGAAAGPMSIGFLELLWLAGLVFMFCLYAIHLIAVGYGLYRLHKPTRKRDPKELPAVSIIKPLLGVDDNLFANLESYFVLDYPEYELLFCAMDRDDPALEVVRRLLLKYPSVAARTFVGGELVGLNPKVNNMMPAYRAVRHPLVLFSDAGIFMPPTALSAMVDAMTPSTGLVFQVPYALPRPGFAALVEQIYFGTDHAKISLAGRALRFVGVSGMSSLVRKKALDDCGGIAAFHQYIAEDHLIALALKKRGWDVDMCSRPALQNAAGVTIASFHDRMFRWMKLRLSMVPLLLLLDPLHDCFVSGLIGALSASRLLGVSFLSYYSVHVAFWLLCDLSLVLILENGRLQVHPLKFALAWLYREFTVLPIFFRSLLQPEFAWRTGIYRLRSGGIITEAKKVD
uniref:ceramide glucosyltransferase n=1 Tax=Steinernema glaseri TaxID=37863 RepID=A0A1I7XZY5_9BILA